MTQMIPFDEAPAGGGGTRTPVLVAAGLAAALALGGGGYFLLSGGEEPVASAPVSKGVTKTVRKAAPVVKKPVAKPAVKTVPVVAKAQLGRDPFRALYMEPVKAAPGTVPTTTTPTTTTPGGSFSPTGSEGQTYSLQLTRISREGAANARTYFYTFSFAGTSKTVMQGQRFGKYGELVVLGYVANSKGAVVGAVLQVGDDNPFPIGVKEKISVK